VSLSKRRGASEEVEVGKTGMRNKEEANEEEETRRNVL